MRTRSDDELALNFEVAAAIIIICATSFPWNWWWNLGSDQAAWVQAVGSIFAILAGVWLQDRHAEKQRADNIERQLRILNNITETISIQIEAANTSTKKKRWNSYLVKSYIRRLDGLRKIYDKIDPSEIYDESGIDAYANFAVLVSAIEVAYEYVGDCISNKNEVPAEHFKRPIELATSVRNDAIRALNSDHIWL